jgi:hypothetical protein
MSLLLVILVALPATAQEPVDQAVLARIKTEGMQNSQIMRTLGYLTDVYGPRLTGSPNLKAAQEWCRDQLTKWGLERAELEPWGGQLGPGWSVNRFSVEMVEPQYLHVIAYPMAWTPSTTGTVSGQPVLVQIKSPADFEKYRGQLKGAIVMHGRPSDQPQTHFEPEARRFTDQELARQAQATDPASKALNPYAAESYWEEKEMSERQRAQHMAMTKFFHDEGVAALLVPSSLDSGILRVTEAGGYDINREDRFPRAEQAFPAFVLAREHYGRIARMLEKNLPIKLEVNLQTTSHPPSEGYNVVAELPGTDPQLKDEVVMLGGHLDSWHSGTGATDNAAGSAVMMEAMRLLKAIGVKPRRTIRVALWSGEEEGYLGSLGYVKKHFGDPRTMELKPEHAKLSAYFNLDSGTGRIRGIYSQGNKAVRPIFESYLKPFHPLGASTVSLLNDGGTDHMPFDALGLPGFDFIQDDIDYETRTHHSHLDVYEALLADDLKQAAVIVASFVYHTAMRNEKLPRKPLPSPQPKSKAAPGK